VAVRIVVIVLALAGAAWLAVAARSFDAQDRIATLALGETKPSQADLAQARALVPRATRLNPDVRVEQGIGVLEFRLGDDAAATATFERLTRREPRNAELWALLARVARDQDPALAARAQRRADALSPPLTR
jgi:tetratricopeptide (TPR) repeat protein